MYRLHGVPQKDIAKELGVSPTLVNFMIRDALVHCRKVSLGAARWPEGHPAPLLPVGAGVAGDPPGQMPCPAARAPLLVRRQRRRLRSGAGHTSLQPLEEALAPQDHQRRTLVREVRIPSRSETHWSCM